MVVPAYNEEAYLPALLASLWAAADRLGPGGRGAVEVVVVDNASTDRTAEVARSGGARVVVEPKRQIAAARNAGVRAARGAVVLTCDADNVVSDNLLVRVGEEMASGLSVGGGVRILPAERRWYTDLLFAAFDFFARGLGLGFGVFFTTPDIFWKVGGFPEDVYVGEDGFFSLALKKEARRRGQGLSVLRDVSIRTSLRKVDEFGFINLLWQHFKFVLMPWLLHRRSAAHLWYDVRKK